MGGWHIWHCSTGWAVPPSWVSQGCLQEEGTRCYLSYWSKHWSISHWWQPWTRFWFLKSYPWIRAQTPPFLQVITICPKPSITEIPVSVPELLCGLEGTCLPCCSGAATHPGAVLALWPPKLHLGITSPAKSADCVKGSKSSEVTAMAADLAFVSERHPSSSEGSCSWGLQGLVHTSLGSAPLLCLDKENVKCCEVRDLVFYTLTFSLYGST